MQFVDNEKNKQSVAEQCVDAIEIEEVLIKQSIDNEIIEQHSNSLKEQNYILVFDSEKQRILLFKDKQRLLDTKKDGKTQPRLYKILSDSEKEELLSFIKSKCYEVGKEHNECINGDKSYTVQVVKRISSMVGKEKMYYKVNEYSRYEKGYGALKVYFYKNGGR